MIKFLWKAKLNLNLKILPVYYSQKTSAFQTCICIWKNGKETVECINGDLGEIPEGIEPSTQVIDVRGNNISNLVDDIFVDVSWTKYISY